MPSEIDFENVGAKKKKTFSDKIESRASNIHHKNAKVSFRQVIPDENMVLLCIQ